MSKPKYKQGRRITGIDDFDKCDSLFYKVCFGNNTVKTIHRSFLISWSYRLLHDFIQLGRVYEGDPIEEEIPDGQCMGTVDAVQMGLLCGVTKKRSE